MPSGVFQQHKTLALLALLLPFCIPFFITYIVQPYNLLPLHVAIHELFYQNTSFSSFSEPFFVSYHCWNFSTTGKFDLIFLPYSNSAGDFHFQVAIIYIPTNSSRNHFHQILTFSIDFSLFSHLIQSDHYHEDILAMKLCAWISIRLQIPWIPYYWTGDHSRRNTLCKFQDCWTYISWLALITESLDVDFNLHTSGKLL